MALIACVGFASPLQAEELSATETLMQLLREASKSGSFDELELSRSLVSTGKDALPVLFAALDTHIIPADEGALVLSDAVLGSIWAAFGKLPTQAVREHVASLADPRFGERTRSTALRLIGGIGSAEDLFLIGRLAAPKDTTPSTAMRVPFAFAIAKLLERDASALQWIERLYTTAHDSLRPTLLRKIGHAEAPDRLAVLASLLGLVRRADGHVLREIDQVASSGRGTSDEFVCGSVRTYLQDQNPVLIQVAAEALGALRDEGAILALIDVVHRGDIQASPSATRALTLICGRNFGSDSTRWQHWYDTEKQWWRDRASSLFADLRHEDAGRVAAAIQQISTKRLYREELAKSLLSVLNRPEPSLRMLACVSLGLLEAEGARHGLTRLLEDPDLSVRNAAKTAVSKLSFRIVPRH